MMQDGRNRRAPASGRHDWSSAGRAASALGNLAAFDRRRREMTLQIGDTAPDFKAETTEGPINFHDWIGNSWAVLFSHPKDFTPVCTTELGYMAKIKPEFDKRNVKIVGLSVDPVDRHAKWADDIAETQGQAPNYPMIGDDDFNVSKLYGMLATSTSGDPLERTPADNQTVRNVFVVGPDKKIKLILVYPMTTGRNFDEVLRVIDSLQLTAEHKVATPVNWQQGEDVIIAGSVSDDQAKEIYPEGWKATRSSSGSRFARGPRSARSSETSATGRSSPASFKCEPQPAALTTMISAPALLNVCSIRRARAWPSSFLPAWRCSAPQQPWSGGTITSQPSAASTRA